MSGLQSIFGAGHDSYQRRLKDLPLGGQSVVTLLRVRRYLCTATGCSRRTFAEPLPELTMPYARFTMRVSHTLELHSDSRWLDVPTPG
ncbi:hypothetical protein [Streptomyces sp. NPDC005538]|uniref:hypothetical protein n=1 Tax=unclassified Streptomyces TaxID=2593676 RepID=UPI0033ACCEC3